MKVLILSILLVATAFAVPTTHLEFKSQYNMVVNGQIPLTDSLAKEMYTDFLLSYGNEDLIKDGSQDRLVTFKLNLERIISHNNDETKSWKMGINKFQDMTDEEFNAHYNMKNFGEEECSATASPKMTKKAETPAEHDWRKIQMPHGIKVVTPVKDQGHCGSCWAFSTIGGMESHYTIFSGKYAILSEQQLVDCAQEFGNEGCNGGLPEKAFNYISENGLTFSSRYPYKGEDKTCTYNDFQKSITSKLPFVIERGNEDQLVDQIYNVGPVSVAYQVADDFRFYESGVYTSDTCGNGPGDVNHAVLAVGYGNEDNLDHYIIKNSWSDTWGDEGFFKIERGVNMCGIAVCNSHPTGVSDIWRSTKDILKSE